MSREWSFYFPEDGQALADATPIIGRILDAKDAAHEACEYDYHSRDGWERGEAYFPIVVVSPGGIETRFMGCHEQAINHTVREHRS